MIKQYLKNIQLSTFFLGIICLFPLFKIHYNSYAIIIFALVCLGQSYLTNKNKILVKNRFKEYRKIILISSCLVFVFALTLFYTENIEYGFKSLQHLVTLLIFPILFFLFMEKLSKKEINLLLTIFLSACIIQVIFIHYNFYNLGLYGNMKEATFYNLPFRDAVLNLSYESQHPSYISLWYTFSIAILIKRIPQKIKSFRNLLILIFIFLLIFLLIGTIVLLSSRIGFISLIVVVCIYLINIKNAKIKWGLFLLMCLALIFSFKNISYLSARFISEFKETALAPPKGKSHNSVNIRIGIYQCSVDIIKENPILGVGIGDVQDVLNQCYRRYNTDAYIIQNYNSHNYFFNVLMVSGIFGLLSFLIMFYLFFKIAISNKNFLYLCLLSIIFIGLLFENILSRNHGVLFFALFNTIYIQYLYKKNILCLQDL